MKDENSGDHPPADSQHQPTPQTPMVVPTPQQDEVRHDTNCCSCNKENKPNELEQDIRNGERWLIGINGFGVAMAIVVAFIYYCQLHTMQRQLEMSDRPWIKGVIEPNFDLVATNGSFSSTVRLSIDNVGHSVATNIFSQVQLITPLGADIIDGPRKKVTELCNDASQRANKLKQDPNIWDVAVFPGSPVGKNHSVVVSPEDMAASIVDGGNKLGRSIPLMLVGCIVYDYPTALRFHRTGFVYFLTHKDDPTLTESSRIFFSLGRTITKDNLVPIDQGQLAD